MGGENKRCMSLFIVNDCVRQCLPLGRLAAPADMSKDK